MVVLRKMKLAEFPTYCEYFIEDYSQEIVENYGHSMVAAIDLAENDLKKSFPNGPQSKHNDLMCIETEIKDEVTLIGYLWYSKNANEDATFICDFYVFPKFRGNGFGKQAIRELERQMQAEGIGQIKLRVAYHNKRALKLYQDTGFLITGYNMSKKIGVKG